MRPCGYKRGPMPGCVPLATSRVPEQEFPDARYASNEALTKGTLYPGLDLPFKNVSNTSHPYEGSPKGEFMALNFIIKELQLYLDTHPDDSEALELLKDTIHLERDAHKVFARMCGPVKITDLKDAESYSWVSDPWPWEFCRNGGKD